MALTFSVSGGPDKARFVVDGKPWSQSQVIEHVSRHSNYVYSTRKPVQLILIPDRVTAVSKSKCKLQPEQIMSLSAFWPSLSKSSRPSGGTKQAPDHRGKQTVTPHQNTKKTPVTQKTQTTKKTQKSQNSQATKKTKQTQKNQVTKKTTATQKPGVMKQTRQTHKPQKA